MRLFPPAANRDTLTVAQLADLYVAAYRKGRDSSRLHYLSEWVERRAMARVRELDADRIAHPNETGTHREAACESGASVVVIALREYVVR